MLIMLVNITYIVFQLTCSRFEQTLVLQHSLQFSLFQKLQCPLIHTSQNNELVLLTLTERDKYQSIAAFLFL